MIKNKSNKILQKSKYYHYMTHYLIYIKCTFKNINMTAKIQNYFNLNNLNTWLWELNKHIISKLYNI